ncbi:MAG: hypothetical protein R3B06_04965 [Kofleriaceae bacterium]
MRRNPWWIVVAMISAGATGASADQIDSEERGATLAIEQPRVTARLVDGTAEVTVTYDVHNRSRFADAASIDVGLPAGAQVAGVRQRVGARWIDGRLLDGEAADARFQDYRDAAFAAARGAALFSVAETRGVLRLSYVPPRATVGVAYTLVVPACRLGDRWLAELPTVDDAAVVTVAGGAVLSPATATSLGAADDACADFGWPAATSLADTLRAGDRVAAWRQPLATGARASITSVPAGARRATVVDVALGDQLEAAPRRAAVVFVVDASRSQGVTGIDAQLAIIRGYLGHAPDARVQIVAVRRRATALFSGWVPASVALTRLAAMPPAAWAPANGSNLDAGLAQAAALLAATPGPRRLVAFTDDRLRVALDDAALAAALSGLPADAIAHVVVPVRGATEVVRDFASHFEAVVRPTGGITATVFVGADAGPLRELVRPTRIDGVTVDGDPADALVEGTALRWVSVAAGAPTIAGFIWGRRWQPTLVDDPPARIRAARLALAAGLDVDTDELLGLARLGRVASAVTSWLADDPTWTPGGLPPLEDDLGQSAACCSSICGLPMGLIGVGTIGQGSVVDAGVALPPAPSIEPLLAARVQGCAAAVPRGWRAAVEVETTGAEVVDVRVATSGIVEPVARARFEACAAQAAWDLELDASFARYTRTFTATFAAP